MPSFAWKLSNQQVADVATFVRNSWGNKAPPVTAHQVASVRSELKLQKPELRK
jgi:mono/diheme cytochrome c family protein